MPDEPAREHASLDTGTSNGKAVAATLREVVVDGVRNGASAICRRRHNPHGGRGPTLGLTLLRRRVVARHLPCACSKMAFEQFLDADDGFSMTPE